MNGNEEETLDFGETSPVDEMEINVRLNLDEEEEPMEVSSDGEEDVVDINDDEITDDWAEGVNESGIDIVPDQEMINNLLKKCRRLISMIKRSTILTAYFDKERKRSNIKRNLCYDVKTRWNSTFHLIDSILALREVIERLFNSKHQLHIKQDKIEKISRLEFKSDDWGLLLNLHYVLRPFFHATKALSGRRYPSIGFAYYLYIRLKTFLQEHSKKESAVVKRLKNLLLKQLLYYFENDDDQLELLKVSRISEHQM